MGLGLQCSDAHLKQLQTQQLEVPSIHLPCQGMVRKSNCNNILFQEAPTPHSDAVESCGSQTHLTKEISTLPLQFVSPEANFFSTSACFAHCYQNRIASQNTSNWVTNKEKKNNPKLFCTFKKCSMFPLADEIVYLPGILFYLKQQ